KTHIRISFTFLFHWKYSNSRFHFRDDFPFLILFEPGTLTSAYARSCTHHTSGNTGIRPLDWQAVLPDRPRPDSPYILPDRLPRQYNKTHSNRIAYNHLPARMLLCHICLYATHSISLKLKSVA